MNNFSIRHTAIQGPREMKKQSHYKCFKVKGPYTFLLQHGTGRRKVLWRHLARPIGAKLVLKAPAAAWFPLLDTQNIATLLSTRWKRTPPFIFWRFPPSSCVMWYHGHAPNRLIAWFVSQWLGWLLHIKGRGWRSYWLLHFDAPLHHICHHGHSPCACRRFPQVWLALLILLFHCVVVLIFRLYCCF